MSRVPIRWRLTLWYAGFFAAAMLLLGAGLYIGLRERLMDTLDEQVAAQAALARSEIEFDAGEMALPADLALLDDEAFVRLLDRNGTVIGNLGEWEEASERAEERNADDADEQVPLRGEAVAAALNGESGTAMLEVDGERIRVLTQPVMQGDRIVGVLQSGISAEDINETLTALLSLLAIGAIGMLVLGVGGGYLLAGRALAPVATITRLAGQIGDRDLHTRLNLTLPDDELGRLARTFDTMLGRIEEGFDRQVRFTGDAAHELRTPLSLMRSQVDLALARPRTAEEYRDALQDLDLDLERMARLVSTLLTLARADAGQLPLDRHPVELDATVRLVLEQYRPPAEEQQVFLIDQTAPTSLVADEGMLIQILVNLLSNALAHTPKGGVITAGCRREQDWARLWVSDTGPGIPAEHRARIFDRFYRVDAGRTRAGGADDLGGAGLGLAIVKALVEAHGGRITLVDQRDPGTRIEVRLPAAPPHERT